MAFSLVNLLKETGQLVSERLRYFLHLTNIIEWTLYISTLVFMDPIQLFEPSKRNVSGEEILECPGRVWEIGAIAIFFAWMNMVLFWRRFSKFGLYVVMISTMVITLLKVIIVVLLLVIAYGLVFLLLLRNQPAFHDIGVSLMKVFTMTLGDFEYTSVLPDPGDDNPDESEAVYFPELSYFLFVCFALSMIIIVSNLLVT
jgi:transient receptor potential cation channel subfamily A protein 1